MIKKTTALIMCSSLLIGYLAGCSTVENGEVTEETLETSEIIGRSDIEPIRAQDDYYGYVNLSSLQNMNLDYNTPYAGGMNDIDSTEQVVASIKNLIDSNEQFDAGTSEQILISAYNQFVEYSNSDEIKKEINADVDKELSKITNAQNLDELLEVMYELRREYGVTNLLLWGVSTDVFNPDEYAVIIPQFTELAGVNLKTVNENARKTSDFEGNVELSLRVAGKDSKDAEEVTRDLLYKIIDIAWATNVELMDSNNPYEGFEFVSMDELNSKLTNFTAEEYLAMLGIKNNPYGGIEIQDVEQFVAFDKFMCDENFELIKAAVIYDFVMNNIEYLALSHDELSMYLVESTEEIQRQAVDYLMYNYSLELGELYCKDYYTEEMDTVLNDMIDDILLGYHNVISNSDWLSEEARALLIKKLDNIQFITGGYVLKNPGDYSYKLDLMGDNLMDTHKNMNIYDFDKSINNIGKVHNRLEISMPMYIVNACYTQDNIVNITAAIMNEPCFDVNADKFTNLGGLGAIIGHEIGHGFDSNCLDFDYNGVLNKNWLPSTDVEVLNVRNQSAIDYFENNFPVFDVYYVDGENTLGENYADLGALEVLMTLCESDDDYIKLFENYAKIWSTLMTEEDVIKQLSTDVHSPSTVRVNAILASLDEFYEVYDVQEGDGMYISPENRIGRWN